MGCAATVTGQPWLLVFSVQDPDPDGCGWEWSQQHWGSWGRVQSLFEFAPRYSDRRRLHWKTFCTPLCVPQGPSVNMGIACQEFTLWSVSARFIGKIITADYSARKMYKHCKSDTELSMNPCALGFYIISDVRILHLEAASLTSMIYTGSWGAPESNCMFTSTQSNRRARQTGESDKPALYLKCSRNRKMGAKSAKLLLYKHCHCLTLVFREHPSISLFSCLSRRQ